MKIAAFLVAREFHTEFLIIFLTTHYCEDSPTSKISKITTRIISLKTIFITHVNNAVIPLRSTNHQISVLGLSLDSRKN